MPISPLVTNNFIDSCAFDPKYKPEDGASIELFRLSQEGKLLLQIAHSTQKEIEHPNTPPWVKREAQNLIYTIEVQLTATEVNKLREIEAILAGNGKVENIRQDAKHIFEAQKYGSYFVTTDSRVLNRANELRIACNVNTLKPSEFLSLVRQYLNKQEDNEMVFCSSGNFSAMPKPQEKTKKDIVPYKGYLIQATPYQLADSGEWTINISIWRDTGSHVNIRNFSASNTFKTETEAIQHCINFGRQIIDGKFEACSVADL